jgi:hypothetical protein
MTLDELQSLLAAKKALIRLELENGDWHGVRDLAADIEVLQARIEERTGTQLHMSDPQPDWTITGTQGLGGHYVPAAPKATSTVTPERMAELLALLERAHWLMQETLDR